MSVEKWYENALEVIINANDDFLTIRETLTRIGIPSFKRKELYQSCHILHKRGKYYIVHFKELFSLDGKETTLSDSDILRRNKIASLLEEWGLLKIKDSKYRCGSDVNVPNLKVVKYNDDNWTLVAKYKIGKK